MILNVTILNITKIVFVLTLMLALMCLPVLFANEKVTLKNWLTHPEIKKVRNIYKEVKQGIKKGKLVVLKKEYLTEPYNPNKPGRCSVVKDEIALDSRGRVRYTRYSYMQNYITVTTEHVYDKKRMLRFIYVILGGDDSDSRRAYFNESGNILFAFEKDNSEVIEIRDIKNNMFLVIMSEERALSSYRKGYRGCKEKDKAGAIMIGGKIYK